MYDLVVDGTLNRSSYIYVIYSEYMSGVCLFLLFFYLFSFFSLLLEITNVATHAIMQLQKLAS